MSLVLSGTDGLSDVDGSAATPAIRGTDANTGIFFPAADTIAFAEGGAEIARFDSSGRQIIGGTTSYGGRVTLIPAANPTTASDATNQIAIGEASANSAYKLLVGYINIGGGYAGSIQAIAGGAGTNLLLNADGGNLGIGTSSPYSGSKADVQIASSTANYAFQVRTFDAGTSDGSTTAKVFRTVNSGGGNWANAQYDAWAHIWTKAGTEVGRFDSSGNLLVGASSEPSASVAGVKICSPTVAYSRFSAGNNNTEYYQIGFLNGNGLIGRISTNGSATSYVTSSDYRLKNSITPMTGALEKVALLKPCTYKWNADDSDGEGFIAHELAEVVPQCVSGEKDAVETYTDEDGNEQTRPSYQGIDTSFLVATLTAAIQEQQAIITALTARVEALEGTQP
jgi:hypothetical protein